MECAISNHGVTTKPDVLVALTHFYLMVLGSLRCIGIVDGNLDLEGINLPPRWKPANGTYNSMKYESKGRQVYTLYAEVNGGQLKLRIEQEQTTRHKNFDYESS